MRISRREFLKYCSIAAGALGLTTTDLLKIEESFAKIGNGGPHVVWLPGQACTGCKVSLANTIKERDVASLALFDIDLDYSETLMAAAGAKAVDSAISAIGKTTVLALEGAIPSAATGGDEHFCTVWSRTGGILGAGSSVAAVPSAATDGVLVGAAPVALAANDIIGRGSELVAGTTLPADTIVANAADRAAMGALGATFTSAGGTTYGTDRTNTDVVLSAPMTVVGTVEITGGTDMGNSNGQVLVQGSVLATGTTLSAGTIAASSFDRLWLSEVDTSLNPVNTDVAAVWTYVGPANEWALTGPVQILNTYGGSVGRPVAGPFVVNAGSTIAATSILKTATRVPNAADQTFLITDSGIATLFVYGSTADADVLAAAFSLAGSQEIVLSGTVTLPPLTGGQFGATAETDKTMLHEAELFAVSSAAILCIGTCSSFGGIPAATGNKTGASGALYKGLRKPGSFNGVLTDFAAKTVNIPGCPPHSDWIVGTIAYLLATSLQSFPPVEAYARPMEYYGKYQCNAGPCEWRYNQGYNLADELDTTVPYANPKVDPILNLNVQSSKLYKNKWGNEVGTNNRYTGCIGALGCKGRKTKADCSLRRWNADVPGGYGSGWCVASGAGCHGCTEPTFPDKVGKFFNFA